MLAYLALSLAVLFFVLLRLGVLARLPEILTKGTRRRSPRRLGKSTEEERRLEIFKDFFEGDSKPGE